MKVRLGREPVRDDRGKVYEPWMPPWSHATRQRHGASESEVHALTVEVLGKDSSRWPRVAAQVGLMIALVAWLLWDSPRGGTWWRISVGLIIAVVIPLLSARNWRADQLGKNRGLLRRALIRRRWCPACVYRLEGIEVEPDGCVTCPECGAGWRLEGSAP